MLAKKLDPVEEYARRAKATSPVYRAKLKRRKLSVHARFVASAFDVFAGARIVENIPAEKAQKADEAN